MTSFRLFVMWFIAISIILMNITVFVVTPRLEKPSSATKMTMVSLAITDISIGILAVLRLSYFAINQGFYYNEKYLCDTDGLTYTILGGVSAGSMMFLCIDRVISIKYPLHYPIYCTKKVTMCIIVGIWAFVILWFVTSYSVFGMEIAMRYTLYCTLVPSFQSRTTLMTIVCGFVLPACVIFTCAVIMLRIVQQQKNQIRALECAVTQASRSQVLLSHMKSIKTIFCMVAGYYICWTPIVVLTWMWTYLYGHIYSPEAEAITGWFVITNSVVNSLVYLPTMKEYRETFTRILLHRSSSNQIV